jgi:hypothetical protein
MGFNSRQETRHNQQVSGWRYFKRFQGWDKVVFCPPQEKLFRSKEKRPQYILRITAYIIVKVIDLNGQENMYERKGKG